MIRNNEDDFPSVEWKNGSIYKLSYSNESFDISFSFFVLEYLVFPGFDTVYISTLDEIKT